MWPYLLAAAGVLWGFVEWLRRRDHVRLYASLSESDDAESWTSGVDTEDRAARRAGRHLRQKFGLEDYAGVWRHVYAAEFVRLRSGLSFEQASERARVRADEAVAGFDVAAWEQAAWAERSASGAPSVGRNEGAIQ